jgi:drug/metabolite transporter (DMT)-like permease
MSKVSDNVRGAALMAASMAGYVLNDTMVKLLSDSLSIFQVMFLRGLFATTLLGLIAWKAKSLFPAIEKSDWRFMILRLTGEIGATFCYLTALFNMPLANATAILQALPLAVTLGAALFFGEPVGWRRYLAIIIGFVGVLIIVRPGAEGFNAYSMSALAAVGFIVLRDLSTRRLPARIPSIFVALLTSVGVTVMGAVLSPAMDWELVGASELKLLGAAALFLVCGYLFSVMTMRVGEISFISPFRYSILIWAIILGIVVFGDIPDGWTVFGSTIVVLMGTYTFYRERKIQGLGQRTKIPT